MTEFVKVAGVETPVEVAQILNKIIDEKGNVDLDNLSEVGEKRFSDLSSSITNIKNSVSSLTTTVNRKIGATVSKAENGYIKFTNGVIIQWGEYSASSTWSRITLPIAYTGRYIPVTTLFNSNLKNTLFDGHLPCVVTNVFGSYFERQTYVGELFWWVTVGY